MGAFFGFLEPIILRVGDVLGCVANLSGSTNRTTGAIKPQKNNEMETFMLFYANKAW